MTFRSNVKIVLTLNQIFYYTRCITPKRVTSWQDPSSRHCARVTQLLLKKCRSDGEPLATLCPILPVRNLNLRLPAPETNALAFDQLAGYFNFEILSLVKARKTLCAKIRDDIPDLVTIVKKCQISLTQSWYMKD